MKKPKTERLHVHSQLAKYQNVEGVGKESTKTGCMPQNQQCQQQNMAAGLSSYNQVCCCHSVLTAEHQLRTAMSAVDTLPTCGKRSQVCAVGCHPSNGGKC